MDSTSEELGRLLVEQRKIFTLMHNCGICHRVYTQPDEFVDCLVKCNAYEKRLDLIKPEIDKLTQKLMS